MPARRIIDPLERLNSHVPAAAAALVVAIIVSVTTAAYAQPIPIPSPLVMHPIPTSPSVPATAAEFFAINLLLASKQGISLGSPVAAASQTPPVMLFQAFREAGDSSFPINSEEIQGDIYVAYTPTTAPLWYDISLANDAGDSRSSRIAAGADQRRQFGGLKADNVEN
jgi:hypothetical protein